MLKLNKVTLWMKKNRLPIMVSFFFVAYGILAYVITPHYTWFEWHRYIMAIGVLILGLITAFLGFFLLFVGSSLTLNALIALFYFAVVGFLLGSILKFSWQKGWAGKIALCSASLVNLGIGVFMLAWGDVLVTENPSLNCQNFINQDQGLRIVTFERDRVLPGAYYFYLYSADGGKSWAQLYSESNEQIKDADCQTIRILKGNFLYIWSGYHVRTTHDSGNTWEKWDWECCTYGAVENVIFQDEHTGTMTVHLWRSSISELITHDGGKTWSPVK